MADWFIATEGVKVVKDSASLWPQIVTAISSAGAALVGVALTHRFTRRREEATAARKRYDELYFISTELVFLLERFAQRCVYSANESGEYDQDGRIREGANKRGNSSRLTQSFHFFMFEPIFSPVNALNQPI